MATLIQLAPGLVVEHQPGTKSFGIRKGSEGIIWHTSEYLDFSYAQAMKCINDQRNGQPGSYNIHIYDGGAILAVPYLEASGGINPFSPAWAPESWLKNFLSPAAFADPAAYNLQVVFTGKTADIVAGKMPINMWETAAKITKWFEASAWGKDNCVMSAHEDYQTNRSDPGEGTIDKILQYYQKLTAPTVPAPVVVKTYTQVELDAAVAAAKAPLNEQIAALNGRIKIKDSYVSNYPVG